MDVNVPSLPIMRQSKSGAKLDNRDTFSKNFEFDFNTKLPFFGDWSNSLNLLL